MTRKTLAASLAAITLLLSAGTALASTGYATQHVNVRAGAGTGFAITGSLSAGEAVDIVDCDGGWCLTDEGYVSASYLKTGGYDADDEDDDDEDHASVLDEDGELDDDPLGLADDVPESIWSGGEED